MPTSPGQSESIDTDHESHGIAIDRLEITYNIAQGGTQTFTHGGPGGVPAEIDIGRKIL